MKVTCIIPVGASNHKYLQQAIESACLVGYDEIILSVAAAVEFLPAVQSAVTSQQVKLIVTYQPGCGPGKNLAIAQATGDWICTLDSDDLVDVTGQRTLGGYAMSGDCKSDIVFAQVHEFGEAPYQIDERWPKEKPNHGFIYTSCTVPVCAWFKKDVWWRAKGFENVRYEDWHFWKKAVRSGVSIEFMEHDGKPFVFYHHRRWEGAMGAAINWRSDLGHTPL